MVKYYLKPKIGRPDFRLVISFLWSDLHNVDSDGNSDNPAARDWTELYIQNREAPAEIVDVSPVDDTSITLEVCSDLQPLAARVAYFLARETKCGVAEVPDGKYSDPDILVPLLGGDFDLSAALHRAATSVCGARLFKSPTQI